jgi:stage V sporulation protein G
MAKKKVTLVNDATTWLDLVIKPTKEGVFRCTNVQVFPIREPKGKTMAFARVVLGDQLQLTEIRVLDGSNGLFVSYPNDPSYKGDDYKSLSYPVTRELRDHIEECVIWSYLIQVAPAPIPEALRPVKESIPMLLAQLSGLQDQDDRVTGLMSRLQELI